MHGADVCACVHRAGGLAVLGVLLDPTPTAAPNPLLQLALDWAPEQPKADVACPRSVAPLLLLPPRNQQSYVHYLGSLTTPPCTEGVDWIVFTHPLDITYRQVRAYAHRMHMRAGQQRAGGG